MLGEIRCSDQLFSKMGEGLFEMRTRLVMDFFCLAAKTLHSHAVYLLIHTEHHTSPLGDRFFIFMGGIMNLTLGDWLTGLA